jgi:hypothetical protein
MRYLSDGLSYVLAALISLGMSFLGTMIVWKSWPDSPGGVFFGLLFLVFGIGPIFPFIREARSYTPDHLRIRSTGITLLDHPDRFVPFDKIRHVKLHYQVTHKSVNFARSGADHNVKVELTVDGEQRPLRIRAGPLLAPTIGTYGEGDSAVLLSDYKRICSESFETRCAHYVQEIRRDGFFSYDGKRFYMDGDVPFSDGSINLRTMAVMRDPFALECGHRRIHTGVDTDIFFWLLERLFGIAIEANGLVRVTPAGIPGIPGYGHLSWLREHDYASGHAAFDSMFGEGAAELYMKPKTGR